MGEGTDKITIIKKLKTKRAVVKTRITKLLKKLDSEEVPDVTVHRELINNYLAEITTLDEQINELLIEDCDGEEFEESVAKEFDGQTEYITDIKTKLAVLELDVGSNTAGSEVERATGQGQIVAAATASCALKLPELKCDVFTGEGTSTLQFHSFITQFDNIIGLRTNITNATKFTYLRTYLKGYALKLVQHLQVTDENYVTALNLLSAEFLNKDSLINELLTKLLRVKPDNEASYLSLKLFINEVRCVLCDLKAYELDFFGDAAGNKLISHIVFNKFPQDFKQELGRKLANNFPSIQEIFNNYAEIIQILQLKDVPDGKSRSNGFEFSKSKGPSRHAAPTQVNWGTVKTSGKTEWAANRNCKFCTCVGHSMLACKKFPSYKSRVDRCIDLKICSLCSSRKHTKFECKKPLDFECKFCQSKSHISALCPKIPTPVTTNFCLNSAANSGKTFLLPVMTVHIGCGKKTVGVKCLIDSGSQRSYLHARVMKKLKSADKVHPSDIQINTFLESSVKQFAELCLTVDFGEGAQYPVPFLINKDFNLNFAIEGLSLAIRNLQEKFKLSESFESDLVELDALLGVDSLQYLQQNTLINCQGGKALKLKKGLVPYGNIDSFLTDKQLSAKYKPSKTKALSELEDSGPSHSGGACCTASDSRDSSIVNFVLNPVRCYFDPLGAVISEGNVEEGLDRLFSIESLGISDEAGDYDQQQIAKFNAGITFADNHYNVVLPWNDKINTAHSNFAVCKAILYRVVENLHKAGIYEDYNDILLKQVQEDIIEPVDIDFDNFNSQIFIPHRPVVKVADQVTTKIRIVLNCSLKVDNSPSLNECAYPGVNLLSNLLELLIKIRANDFLVMSDVRQAFLMIKLSEGFDRNKFTILWLTPERKLVAYRYKSLVFGFISSPFILNHVVKFHVAKYPPDNCSAVLLNNMYVDNLFFTGSNPHELLALYRQAGQRMTEGGFELRSWASNSEELNATFREDECAASHDSDHERVLGYLYFPGIGKYAVADFRDRGETINVTKRTVLAYTSGVFDPLGVTLPVLVGTKIFMQKLWKCKYEWDAALSEELVREWLRIKTEVDQLIKFSFQRKAYELNDLSIAIYCDSSKDVYGFCCYANSWFGEQDNSQLIFAKAKVAPAKAKTLPTLELMSVFLALKCLPTVVSALNNQVKDIVIHVDAQIVLSWILTGHVKTKNVFARNRVTDITEMRTELRRKHHLECKFAYVPTDYNPADLLTRGLSFNQFLEREYFWLHGPNYQNPGIIMGKGKLGCLSEEAKLVAVNSGTVGQSVVGVGEPIFPLKKFASLSKLLNVTALVFMFIDKLRKRGKTKMDCIAEAKLYWIVHEQSFYLKAELDFLNKECSTVPLLVKNLNLFIDKHQVLRFKGRLGNCSYLSPDLLYPVILPAQSFQTELYIWDAHMECKYLGTASTLSAVRRKGLWIPKEWVTVKSILAKCIICKKINAFAFRYPKVNDYVSDKVNLVTPFKHTGVDYTGHLYVKLGDTVTKMFLLVFTCLNIRAIHLELLPSMNCKDFLFAFVKFCNIFTIPDTIYSDNASTFLQSMGVISNSYSDNDFNDYLHKNSIKHVKIPLYSAWVGAAWERSIRTIKNSLYKVIGRKHMEYFELAAVLSDVQNAINSRPLTYLDENMNALTPNSFLKFDTGQCIILESATNAQYTAPDRRSLTRALEKRNDLLETFRDLWYNEYLLTLRENARDVYQESWENKIKVGDVVLLHNPNKPRYLWQMGRVQELLPGKDGIVRTVKVVRPDRSEGVHSINLLYPLELQVAPVLSPSTGARVVDDAVRLRPAKRKAAINCREKLRACN